MVPRFIRVTAVYSLQRVVFVLSLCAGASRGRGEEEESSTAGRMTPKGENVPMAKKWLALCGMRLHIERTRYNTRCLKAGATRRNAALVRTLLPQEP